MLLRIPLEYLVYNIPFLIQSFYVRCAVGVLIKNPAVYSLETIYLINIDKINYRFIAVKSTNKAT